MLSPGLNEELVQLLVVRDELHMEQDAMLVDIEDLTRWGSIFKEINSLLLQLLFHSSGVVFFLSHYRKHFSLQVPIFFVTVKKSWGEKRDQN